MIPTIVHQIPEKTKTMETIKTLVVTRKGLSGNKQVEQRGFSGQ